MLMSTFGIIVSCVAFTSTFWLGFFMVYEDRLKKREKEKVNRIFKNKK